MAVTSATATATFSSSNTSSFHSSKLNLYHRPSHFLSSLTFRNPYCSTTTNIRLSLTFNHSSATRRPIVSLFSGGEGGDKGGEGNGYGGGDNEGDHGDDQNKKEALMVLGEIGRSLDTLPNDLKNAIEAGRIPKEIILKYLELEKSNLFKWLLQFGGFRERLLADDLFLAKVFIECGVGLFTKTAAEYQRRKENFFNELEVVCADVVMAVIADFMLVYLPAPTVSLRTPIGMNAGALAKFFHKCPDNAFQIAIAGRSFSFMQRFGSILRNGSKLFLVGTTSSLVGTVVTNAMINARKAVDKSSADDLETMPILSTSVGYGLYMSVSSNLRYQILAGVIEQRILEPVLHNHKVVLGAICFAIRTGNTFLGSLLWVDYARWVGIQKVHEVDKIQEE